MTPLGDMVEILPGRHAIDRRYPDISYVPENADFQLREGRVSWDHAGHAIDP